MKNETFIEIILQPLPSDENSLNIYNGSCIASLQRRRNFRAYLSIMQETKPSRLFAGDEPGLGDVGYSSVGLTLVPGIL